MNGEATAVCSSGDHKRCCGFGADGSPCGCECHPLDKCQTYGRDGLDCFTVRYVPGSGARTYCRYCRKFMPPDDRAPEKTTTRRLEVVGAIGRGVPAAHTGFLARNGSERAPATLADRIEMIRMQAQIIERIGSKLTEQNLDLVKVVTASTFRDIAAALEQLAAGRQ